MRSDGTQTDSYRAKEQASLSTTAPEGQDESFVSSNVETLTSAWQKRLIGWFLRNKV